MKQIKSLLCIALVITTCICFIGCNNKTTNKKSPDIESNTSEESSKSTETTGNGNYTIVSSFYPMHILAMNLTKGIDGVTEVSMSEPNIGCIHDHAFTADDLKKIEGADAYIENGLGLEVFNDKIKEAYPDTQIIEASTNITRDVQNPHVFTNIDDYILQVQYVSEQLKILNPENKDHYAANEKEYIDKLNQLKSDYSDKLTSVAGKKVLILDEAIPGFCDYVKLDTMEIETDHEEEALSADDIKNAIKKMKAEDIKTIIIGKDANRSIAETIAAETNATIYEVNTCMVGTKDSDLDSYINEMKENFDSILAIE